MLRWSSMRRKAMIIVLGVAPAALAACDCANYVCNPCLINDCDYPPPPPAQPLDPSAHCKYDISNFRPGQTGFDYVYQPATQQEAGRNKGL